MTENIKQKTLKRPVECSGIGMHSGDKVFMKIKPAPENYGIRFVRTDLPDNPVIRAHFNLVTDTTYATVLGAHGAIVSTIEHLMAALFGMEIDNAAVEISSYEIPIMDGSAAIFTKLIKKAGVKAQNSPKIFFAVKKPIELEQGDKFVGIYPHDVFKISYTIQYAHPPINTQKFSLDVNSDMFEEKICSARTYGFLQEIEFLQKNSLAKGGSLENAVVIDGTEILNESGLRFEDEFVRHKILDCIGDLALLGMPVIGHLRAYKSGHAFNHAFLEKMLAAKDCWETTVR